MIDAILGVIAAFLLSLGGAILILALIVGLVVLAWCAAVIWREWRDDHNWPGD